jgi:nicotinate-nucleotide adenylyltransferase
MHTLGILGGTFDPVHMGHLETALAARRALALDRVLLVPSNIPPHRRDAPAVSAFHRFAMTALAVQGCDRFEASDTELQAGGTSYTSDTLDRLHATGIDRTQIFFITGADAFAEIETWRRYPEVLDLAHFVVVSRPGYPAPALPARLPRLASRMLAGTPEAARASKPAIFLVDAETPDVSSTEVRKRIHRGASIAGLVPTAVERHITQHRLYLDNAAHGPISTAADHLHGKD